MMAFIDEDGILDHQDHHRCKRIGDESSLCYGTSSTTSSSLCSPYLQNGWSTPLNSTTSQSTTITSRTMTTKKEDSASAMTSLTSISLVNNNNNNTSHVNNGKQFLNFFNLSNN
jgi:hypothetical protein